MGVGVEDVDPVAQLGVEALLVGQQRHEAGVVAAGDAEQVVDRLAVDREVPEVARAGRLEDPAVVGGAGEQPRLDVVAAELGIDRRARLIPLCDCPARASNRSMSRGNR